MVVHSPKIFSALSLIQSNMFCQKKKCTPEILLDIMMQAHISVCNFQSMKSPVELNSLFLKFFCYTTWFDHGDATMEALQTRLLRQILLFLRNNSLSV